MKEQPNTLTESIDSSFNISGLTKQQRLMILPLLGTLLTCGTPVNEAEAKGQIPICHNMKGHRTPSKSPWLEDGEQGKVACVVDGDTLDVQLKNNRMARIRLWGLDCDESSFNSKCMKNGKAQCAREVKNGKRATNKVRSMLGNGNVVLKGPFKSNGNRKLAYVHLANGIDLGRKLISSCLCEEGYRHERKQDYRRAADRCNK